MNKYSISYKFDPHLFQFNALLSIKEIIENSSILIW